MTRLSEAALKPIDRMPVGFGAARGPRNVPADVDSWQGPERRTTYAFTTAIASADVEPLLPDELSLLGDTMIVRVHKLSNLRWLAGRAYDIVAVSFPVVFGAGDGEVPAEYLAVLWESMADPVLTGREELGFPKLFADIDAPAFESGSPALDMQASWDGAVFFTATARGFETTSPSGAPQRPIITRRYLPAVGELTEAAVDHLAITEPSGGPPATVVDSATGVGEFTFHSTSWQQNPIQQAVINTLADLAMSGPVTVEVTCIEGQFSDVSNRRLT